MSASRTWCDYPFLATSYTGLPSTAMRATLAPTKKFIAWGELEISNNGETYHHEKVIMTLSPSLNMANGVLSPTHLRKTIYAQPQYTDNKSDCQVDNASHQNGANCSPGSEVQSLPYRNHHGDQHPYPHYKIYKTPDIRNEDKYQEYPWGCREPNGAQQFTVVRLGLRPLEQFGANEVGNE